MATAPVITRRWLLLAHQLPATPSVLRVRTWRRLQQLGALQIKQALYVLPDSPDAREDFEWLKAEIEGSGGEASVFAADALDQPTDEALFEAFRKSAQTAYAQLAVELQRAVRSEGKRAGPTRGPNARKLTDRFKQRMAAIERTDFFAASGRDRVVALLTGLTGRAAEASAETPAELPKSKARAFTRRVWVTRRRPGVDRMASAWLIRRFIDPHASFAFVSDAKAVPADAIAFDMFGVEFSHHGSHCTFETLCERFAIRDRAVQRLAEIVHDLDLKDDKFGAADAATVGALVDGLQRTSTDDQTLLERGRTMFESLYQSFLRDARVATRRPRPGPGAARRSRPTR